MNERDQVDLPDWYDSQFDAYCLEVGRLTTMWAAFERHLDGLVWEMLDVHAHVGACLTAQMIGPGPRIRALIALAGVKRVEQEIIKKLHNIGARAEKLGGQRNRYIHDTVGIGTLSNAVKRHEITANKKLRFEQLPVDLNDVRRLWIDIQNLEIELLNVGVEILPSLPVWPRGSERAAQSLNQKPKSNALD